VIAVKMTISNEDEAFGKNDWTSRTSIPVSANKSAATRAHFR
jgi:hypothetical protein